MISGAAFCPHPPLLVPAVAGGATAEMAALRASCRTSVTKIASLSDRLLLLGAGHRTTAYPSAAVGSLAGFGVDVRFGLTGSPDGLIELPLSLTIGAELIDDAVGPGLPRVAVSIAEDSGADADRILNDLVGDGRVGLVVMGDGSARRSTAAPGYLDERAAAFDDAVADILRTGDAYALEDLDAALAGELLAAGGPVWRAAGRLLRNARYDAELLAYEAPFGVAYFVASWVTRG